MLRLMRDKFKSLQWVLWLVIFAFVATIFYAWGMGGTGGSMGSAAPQDAAIEVDGASISRLDFERRVVALEQSYRQQFGDQAETFLRQANLRGNALNSLIEREIGLREARRMGLEVGDEELRQHIIDTFVDADGSFVGRERLESYARYQGYSPDGLRAAVADDLLLSKARDLVLASAVVSDSEVRAEYQRRNDKAEIEYVLFSADRLAGDQASTGDQLRVFYDSHPERFEEQERQARYLVFPASDHRGEVEVDTAEVRDEYQLRAGRGDYDEQRRARHILLKTDTAGDDPAAKAAIEQRARKLLDEIRGGAEFAALARASSEDAGSAVKGGDLGFFGRGQMVKPFEDAVFALAPGEVSDLVETSFGFHIIKLEEVRPPRTYADAEAEIRADLIDRKAREAARAAADQALAEGSGGLDEIATTHAMTVHETPFFRRTAPPEDVDPAYGGAIAYQLFHLDTPGELAPRSVSAGDDTLLLEYSGEQGPIVPPFDDIEADVRREERLERGRHEAAAHSAEMTAALASDATGEGDDAFSTAAGYVEGEVATATVWARNMVVPGISDSEPLAAAAYALPIGEVSPAIDIPSGSVILRVMSRFQFDEEAFAAERESVRASLEKSRGAETWTALVAAIRRDLEAHGSLVIRDRSLLDDNRSVF